MGSVKSARIESLALPVRGLNTEIPPALMPPEFCPQIVNYSNEGNFFESRTGLRGVLHPPNDSCSGMVPHPTNPNLMLAMDTTSLIANLFSFDGTTNAVVGNIGTTSTDPEVLAWNYRRTSFFFLNGGPPLTYDGTTYTTMSITGPTAANVIGGCVHRNRIYIFESNSGSVWYTALPKSVGGTFYEFEVEDACQQSGNVICIFSLSLAEGRDSNSYFCTVFDTGEMVVYGGASPESADWSIVGTFNVGRPLGRQSYINVDGDIWIITRTGVVSARNIISGNQNPFITENIESFWKAFIERIESASAALQLSIARIRGAYHQGKKKVLITFPASLVVNTSSGSYDYSFGTGGGATFLVYDIPTKSWVPQHTDILIFFYAAGAAFITPFYWANKDRFFIGCTSPTADCGWEFFRSTGSSDVSRSNFEWPFSCILRTSYTKSNYMLQVGGVFVTHAGNYHLISRQKASLSLDYNTSITSQQDRVSTTSNNVSMDFYPVGASGRNVAVDLSTLTQTTDTDEIKYNLYSIDLLLEQGGGIS